MCYSCYLLSQAVGGNDFEARKATRGTPDSTDSVMGADGHLLVSEPRTALSSAGQWGQQLTATSQGSQLTRVKP